MMGTLADERGPEQARGRGRAEERANTTKHLPLLQHHMDNPHQNVSGFIASNRLLSGMMAR